MYLPEAYEPAYQRFLERANQFTALATKLKADPNLRRGYQVFSDMEELLPALSAVDLRRISTPQVDPHYNAIQFPLDRGTTVFQFPNIGNKQDLSQTAHTSIVVAVNTYNGQGRLELYRRPVHNPARVAVWHPVGSGSALGKQMSDFVMPENEFVEIGRDLSAFHKQVRGIYEGGRENGNRS